MGVSIKMMGTIASELKAPSQNTPHSSIIIYNKVYLQVPECYQGENIIVSRL